MTDRHTPGPWVLDGYNMSSVIRCIRPRGHIEAVHTCGDYETIADCHGDNWRPNARLIAAAPDLLSEAKKQLDWLRHIRTRVAGAVPGSILNGIDQSIKAFSAVIDKAEGEE